MSQAEGRFTPQAGGGNWSMGTMKGFQMRKQGKVR